MRVISQSGKTDLPYENFVIGKTASNEIVAMKTVANCPQNVIASVIAKYSTEEKAIKAMEMLRDVYEHGIFVPNDKYDPNDTENWLTNTKGFYHHTSLFQFPSDDEIEV